MIKLRVVILRCCMASFCFTAYCSKIFGPIPGLRYRGGSENAATTIITEDNNFSSIQNVTTSEWGTIDHCDLLFGASKVGDGSESDPDGIPTRYLRMQKGNREKAKQAFLNTVQWREDEGINSILATPFNKFDLCRIAFPVRIPGLDREDNIVLIQRVGLINFDYCKNNNLTSTDILLYYIYINEYCWNVLDPNPDGLMTTIMDLEGVKLNTFRDKQKRSFLLKFVQTMSDHYPNRSYKTIIINAPSWVNLVFRIVKPLLRESTKQKIVVFNGGAKQDKALVETLGIDAVPKGLLHDAGYIEKDVEKIDETSSIEIKLHKLCQSVLETHGCEMLTPRTSNL